MNSNPSEKLQRRLHEAVDRLLQHTDVEGLLDRGDIVAEDLDSVDVDKSGHAWVTLSRMIHVSVSLGDILAMADEEWAVEVMAILEEIRNLPAPTPRRKAMKSIKRG